MSAENIMKVSFLSRSGNETLARMVVSAFLVQADPTVEELDDIKTAVSEAVTNSIVHGYGIESSDKYIEMQMSIEENIFSIAILDKGCGIEDIDKAMEAFYSGDSTGERSGMGFTIMQAFMSDFRVESVVGEGTSVYMKKLLHERQV